MKQGKNSELILKRSIFNQAEDLKEELILGSGMGEDSIVFTGEVKADQDIVMTKWVGLVGTSIIASKKERELIGHFNQEFVNRAKDLGKNLLVVKEVNLALDIGASLILNIREGGVNKALWDVAKHDSLGLEINIRDIPIKQETIEICELYDLNPYELISGGSILVVTNKGNLLVKRLQDNGIHASIIGRVTRGNDKIAINGQYKRYLTPTKNDELYKLLNLIT